MGKLYLFNQFHYYAKFLTHAKIVAYTFLNLRKKVHQILSSIKKDAQKRKLVHFFLRHGVVYLY